MEQFLSEENFALLLGYAVSVVKALVFLFIGWIIAGWLRRITVRALERAKVDQTLIKFFGNIVRYTVLILVVLACLSLFGINTTSFAAVIGAAGLAIGLAFQGTLGHFASGVMLLVFRPFKVGDVVSTGGVWGKVNEIELFTTTLDTPDNRRIIIPNGTIFGSTIENLTFHPTRRVDVSVGTDYGADLDKARQIMMEAAKNTPNTLSDPAPQIYLVALGGSSIDWQVRAWCNTPDFFSVKDELTLRVKKALDAADIGIPFPQMDLHLDADVAEALAKRN